MPVIRSILKLLSFASIYEFTFRVMRKANRWQDEECIRFWFAEAYWGRMDLMDTKVR